MVARAPLGSVPIPRLADAAEDDDETRVEETLVGDPWSACAAVTNDDDGEVEVTEVSARPSHIREVRAFATPPAATALSGQLALPRPKRIERASSAPRAPAQPPRPTPRVTAQHGTVGESLPTAVSTPASTSETALSEIPFITALLVEDETPANVVDPADLDDEVLLRISESAVGRLSRIAMTLVLFVGYVLAAPLGWIVRIAGPYWRRAARAAALRTR